MTPKERETLEYMLALESRRTCVDEEKVAALRAALRSRPAPPDDLVALVREWAAAHHEWMAPHAHSQDGPEYRRYDLARTALLAWAAPAPVAAPAPETPINEHVVGYTPGGTPLMRVANINAAGNTDVGVYAMPQLKRPPAPERPAPSEYTFDVTSTDAAVWAEAWMHYAHGVAERKGTAALLDEGWMLSWFANAMVAVSDAQARKAQTPAPDAMPELQVGDWVRWRRAADGEEFWTLRLVPADVAVEIKRNGVVIWRRQETP